MSHGVTVKNGTITGFITGVAIIGGGNNTLSKLNIHDNVGPDADSADFGDGVYIDSSAANRVTASKIIRNGRYDGIFIGGTGADGNQIDHNTITDNNFTTPTFRGGQDFGPDFSAEYGINLGFGLAGTTSHTVIDSNIVSRSGTTNIQVGNRTGGFALDPYTTITNNYITRAGFLSDGKISLAACSFGYPDGVGLWIGGTPDSDVPLHDVVANNVVEFNAQQGIGTYYVAGSAFTNNVVLHNATSTGLSDSQGSCQSGPYLNNVDLFVVGGCLPFTAYPNIWRGNVYGIGNFGSCPIGPGNYQVGGAPAQTGASPQAAAAVKSSAPAPPEVHRRSQMG